MTAGKANHAATGNEGKSLGSISQTNEQPFYRLSKYLSFPNLDQEQWWNRAAPLLGKMLADGQYDVHQQYQYLCLFALHVIPMLGPFPLPPRPGLYKHNTGFLGALEFSHNFTKDRSTVRIGLEATGHAASTGRDTFNRFALDEALNKLKQLDIGVNLHLYHELINKLVVTDAEERLFRDNDALETLPTRNQHMIAFELKDGGATVRLYLYPHLKSSIAGVSVTEMIFDAVRKVDTWGVYTGSLAMVETFAKTLGPNAWFHHLSCDLLEPNKSRFKLYLAEFQVDFDNITRMWTLGGQLSDPETMAGLSMIKDLWTSFKIPDGLRSTSFQRIRPEDPPTLLPLCINYEIRPGKPTPQPKLYIPIVGINDMAIARILTDFFEKHGFTGQSKPYTEQLSSYLSLYKPECNVNESSDFLSWLAFSYSKKTGPYLTLYYH